MSDIASVLTVAKLSKYAAALDAAGYDDLKFLTTRTESQLREVAKSVNMPVGHADRFVFAITKAKTNPVVKTPMPTSSANTSSPAAASPAKLEKPPAATESPKTTSAPPALPEASSAAPVPPRDPGVAECVAICIDHSGSMGGKFQEMKARGENGLSTDLTCLFVCSNGVVICLFISVYIYL